MGTLGEFEYPDITLEEAVQIARVVDEKFKGRADKLENLATVLNHKTASSGGFRGKLTALNRYGLSTGRGFVQLTEPAKSILHPKNEDERRRVALSALLSVDLLRRVHERLKGKVKDDDFWVDLVEITHVDRSVAQKEAFKVRKIYIEGLNYVKYDESLDTGGGMRGQTSQVASPSHTLPTQEASQSIGLPPGTGGIKPIAMGDIYILCPPGEEDKAIQLLEIQKGTATKRKSEGKTAPA